MESEFSKAEWWQVTQQVRPDWTQEQFDAAWDEFIALKGALAWAQ